MVASSLGEERTLLLAHFMLVAGAIGSAVLNRCGVRSKRGGSLCIGVQMESIGGGTHIQILFIIILYSSN